jgi:hypothetical protein
MNLLVGADADVFDGIVARLEVTADQMRDMGGEEPPEGHKDGGHVKNKVYLAKNVDQMKYELTRSKK